MRVLLLSVFLILMPWPSAWMDWRPDWISVTLIAFCVFLPGRVHIIGAWCLGLMVDILSQDLLGLHALGYSLVVYFASLFHYRLRSFPVWQQACCVTWLVFLQHVVYLWLRILAHGWHYHAGYFISALMTLWLWPCVRCLIALDRVRPARESLT